MRVDRYDQSRTTYGPSTSFVPSMSSEVRGARSSCAWNAASTPSSRIARWPSSLSTTAPTLETPVWSGIAQHQPCSYDSMKMLVSAGSGRREAPSKYP